MAAGTDRTPAHRSRRPIRGFLCMGAAALLVGGCGSWSRAEPTVAIAGPPPSTEIDQIVQPVVIGAESGLEVRVWRVNADEAGLAATVREFAEPVPALDERAGARLRASGLELVRIPATALPRLRALASLAGRVDRRWLGQPLGWTEAIRASEFRSERVLTLQGEPARIGAGALRLLVRAWTAPTPAGPRLRLDMAVQNLEPRRPEPGDPYLFDPAGPPPQRQGLVFPSTLVSADLREPFVYLLLPVDPQRPSAFSAGAGVAVDQAQSADVAGPPMPRLPSVGEALLRRRSAISQGDEMRAVVLLIPRLPDQFRLLP